MPLCAVGKLPRAPAGHPAAEASIRSELTKIRPERVVEKML